MHSDDYGQLIFEEKDLLDIYYNDPEKNLERVLINFDLPANNLDIKNFPKLIKYNLTNTSLNEFDKSLQSNWRMPDSYKNLDIAKWVLDQCKNNSELQRAGKELLLFQERNMFHMLQYLKYLVDTMKENNIVWGVGRGSSVSSFVLYLIGIHRINSLYYDLPIEEFIK